MEECTHEKIIVCGTFSCAECYYNQLMNSKDRAPKESPRIDLFEMMLPHHQRLAYQKEKRIGR